MAEKDEITSECEGALTKDSTDKVFVVMPEMGGEDVEMESGLRSNGGMGEGEVEEIEQVQVGKDKDAMMAVDGVGLVMQEDDIALDLYAAQPLQNMEFLKKGEEGGTKDENETKKNLEGLKWAEKKAMQTEFPLGGKFSDKDFPTLREGVNSRGKSKVESQGKLGEGESSRRNGAEGSVLTPNQGTRFVRQHQSTQAGGTAGNKGMKQSMAEMLRAGVEDPVIFEPNKIKRKSRTTSYLFLRI